MDDPKRTEIDALKFKWQQLSSAHRQQEKLVAMLEEVETYLIRLETELGGMVTPSKAENAEEKQQLYHQLKQKKRELDHMLDQVEEITAKDVEIVQDELVGRLLQYAPHLTQAYGMLHQALLQTIEREKRYHELLTGLEDITTQMDVIIDTRKKVKGWGFWRFLLGPGPTTRITRAIERLAKVVSEVVDVETDDEEITLLFQQLAGLTRERWDFTLIDKHYVPLHESVRRLYEQYRQAVIVTRKEKISQTDQLADWIEGA